MILDSLIDDDDFVIKTYKSKIECDVIYENIRVTKKILANHFMKKTDRFGYSLKLTKNEKTSKRGSVCECVII